MNDMNIKQPEKLDTFEIQEVERPTVQAKQAIGANSGSSPPSRS